MYKGRSSGLSVGSGHVLAHASGMLHGGHEVESGVRYILVCLSSSKTRELRDAYQSVRDEDPGVEPRRRASRGGLGMTRKK